MFHILVSKSDFIEVEMHVEQTAGSCMHASDIHAGGRVLGVKSSVQTSQFVGGFEDGGKGGASSWMSSFHEAKSVTLVSDEEACVTFS